MDLLVVADDLTGANDTGAAFAARGYPTSVRRAGVGSVAWPADTAVGALDTDSRDRPADEAADRVAAAVRDAPTDRVYKKVDSTLRGNLAAEVDAALAATDAAFAVVAPAFPATGRVTVGGYHLVDGTPVGEANVDGGVETSFLPDRLAESANPVEHCPVGTVADPAALTDRFRGFATAEATPVVVCDATTEAHLDAVGAAAAAVSAPVLPVGSGGLAGHVRLGPRADVLGVVGSVAPETFAQLDAVPADRVVALDPERAVADPEDAGDDVGRVVDRLAGAEWAVVTAARDPADVETALEAGRAAGLDTETTRARVAGALAAVAAGVDADRGLDGVFATGGAVAGTTLDRLDGEGVRLTGRSVESGVPLGRVEGGSLDGRPFVTKAGGFGSATTIVNCARFLARLHGDG